MGEVLPQGNPPKSLRGQPRTPVRLLAHEKAQRWDQCPRQRHRETKNDADGKTVHPPKEVFDVLDKLDEIAENCSAREGAAINAQTDRIRDLLIGGN